MAITHREPLKDISKVHILLLLISLSSAASASYLIDPATVKWGGTGCNAEVQDNNVLTSSNVACVEYYDYAIPGDRSVDYVWFNSSCGDEHLSISGCTLKGQNLSLRLEIEGGARVTVKCWNGVAYDQYIKDCTAGNTVYEIGTYVTGGTTAPLTLPCSNEYGYSYNFPVTNQFLLLNLSQLSFIKYNLTNTYTNRQTWLRGTDSLLINVTGHTNATLYLKGEGTSSTYITDDITSQNATMVINDSNMVEDYPSYRITYAWDNGSSIDLTALTGPEIQIYCSGGYQEYDPSTQDSTVLLTTAKNIEKIQSLYTYGGVSYARSLIPVHGSANNYIYYLPSGGLNKTFTLQDLSGLEGTPYLQAKAYVNGSLSVITSDYFEADSKAHLTLVEGTRYYLTVMGDSESRELGPFTVTADTTDVPLVLTDLPKGELSLYSGMNFTESYNASTGIIRFSYEDRSGRLKSVNYSIYEQNNETAVYSTVSTTQTGSMTYVGDINKTYKVHLNIQSNVTNTSITHFITFVNGTYKVDMQMPSEFLGSKDVTWYKVIAVSVMLFTALLFGALYSRIAVLTVSLEAVTFSAINWFPIPLIAQGFILLIMFFAILSGGRRIRG